MHVSFGAQMISKAKTRCLPEAIITVAPGIDFETWELKTWTKI